MCKELLIRDGSAISRDIGDETVVLMPSSGMVHVLNETGALVWKGLSDYSTEEEVFQHVRGELADVDVSDDELRRDVNEFIQSLIDSDLARRSVAEE